MKPPIAVSTHFLYMVAAGGAWVTSVHVLPAGLPQRIAVPVLAVAFVVAYFWLLVAQVRQLLSERSGLLRELGAIGFNLLLMLATFGWIYREVGIVDNVRPGNQVVTSYATCIYYSVVTFTTLGYGDFYPQGPARILAAIQALTGYVILGILASAAASILSPHSKPDISSGDG